MRTILIDDEPIALELLGLMLSSYEDIDIVGSYTKPIEALKEIKKIQPDVIFLDIEMGEINGLELAELFMKELDTVEIVFITAYSEYAVDAFEINAIDYLLKPIQEKRLNKTIERLKDKTKEEYGINISDNRLKVNGFGSFEVLDSMDKPLIWRTQKAKELFAYLWNKRERAVSKMLIMETIFPDRDLDKATTLLHTTIYQLRKNLEKLGYLNGITYFNDCYQLDVPIKSDVQELNQVLNLKNHNEKEIEKILKIYKGDFLEEEGYHWAMEFQQTYKDTVSNILEKYAMSQLEYGKLTPVLKICLDKVHKMDTFNEKVAKMMIHYYGKQSNRISLEAFFNDYVESLQEEMGLRPMKSTVDLYRRYMEKI